MTEQLAIVGASARTAAAASAVRAGFDVVAADLFADDDLCSIAPTTRVTNYPNGLLDWLRSLSPKPTAWMYTGALENHPDLIDTMAAVAPLWGNNGDTLRQIRNVEKLRDALQTAKLQFPETRTASTGLPTDGSWLIKSGRGASGSGVQSYAGTESSTQSRQDGGIYQRWVPGDPYSAVYVAAKGRFTLLGVVRQLVGETWLGARDFQYCGAIGPIAAERAVRDQIERVGHTLARQFPLMGLFGVDFIVNSDRVWTIEVNPRYTASVEVIERATGIAAIAAHANACRHGTVPDQSTASAFKQHGKAVLFAKRDITITTTVSNWLQHTAQQSAPWPTLADLPTAHSTISTGRPIISAFAVATSADEVEQQLRATVAIVESQLYSDCPSKQ